MGLTKIHRYFDKKIASKHEISIKYIFFCSVMDVFKKANKTTFYLKYVLNSLSIYTKYNAV